MRVYDNGAFFTVQIGRREVERFARSWPCCNLPDASISFQFDKRNGDLVDILPYRLADQVDGPEAVALADNAQRYGARKLGLEL